MKNDFSELIEYLDKKFGYIDKKFDHIDKRFDKINRDIAEFKNSTLTSLDGITEN